MRSSVLVVWGLVALVPAVAGRDVTTARQDAAAWSSCEGTLCRKIQDEADGLARVKLLRNYVVETVRLLDHLMESMDSELSDIAEEMTEFIGPRCRSAHTILASIVEKSPRRDSDELSAGIMEESTAQRLEDRHDSTEDISDGIETDDQRSDDNLWSTPGSWQSSNTREPWASSTSQPSRLGKELYAQGSYSTPANQQAQGQHNSGWVVTDNDPWSKESREYDDDVRYRNQYDRRPGGSGSGNLYSTTRPLNNEASGHGNVWRPSHGPPSNKDRQSRQREHGSNCKGLQGSPFAVPGIDSWCSVNCGRGYCPPTHCICD
ncbi:hypothetical protein FHG87_001048 [Trinorchestia longiramus]|nr:hypothetical protein FHG87_001048 [Trinorchestia longiramus]